MQQVHYGGRHRVLRLSNAPNRFLAVRSHDLEPVADPACERTVPLPAAVARRVASFRRVARFAHAGVELLELAPKIDLAEVGRVRRVLGDQPNIRFAGKVLIDTIARQPVLYTENLFCQFHPDLPASKIKSLAASVGLRFWTGELEYARNAYFMKAAEGIGPAVFQLALTLLRDPTVCLCHPELIRPMHHKSVVETPQWHLGPRTIDGRVIRAHANVEAAWELSRGAGATIAVIDDGFDLTHEEFQSNGKIVAPRDVTRELPDPSPGGMHGTACAGVACADGRFSASGVAPAARLMPIRCASGVGSRQEADAILWAVQNGADVISCSWGPPDGDWRNRADPAHNQVTPIADHTRLALEFADERGRGGRGCVIVWAAGNGNEPVDNDGYPSCEHVIAVGACNDAGVRSPYSDFGDALWCCFPSNDPTSSNTAGIWTTDRTGPGGFNFGNPLKGDAEGKYTSVFGGTSSAAPGAAGVAALVLARNPALTAAEVRDVLRRCCDKIDMEGGGYNAEGRSPLYGFGRLNARRAVELAG